MNSDAAKQQFREAQEGVYSLPYWRYVENCQAFDITPVSEVVFNVRAKTYGRR